MITIACFTHRFIARWLRLIMSQMPLLSNTFFSSWTNSESSAINQLLHATPSTTEGQEFAKSQFQGRKFGGRMIGFAVFCVVRFSLLCLVSVLSVFLICLLSCIFQRGPAWMTLYSLIIVLMCRQESARSHLALGIGVWMLDNKTFLRWFGFGNIACRAEL